MSALRTGFATLMTALLLLLAGTALADPGNGKGNGKGKGHNDPTSVSAPFSYGYGGGNCTRYTDLTGAGPCTRGTGSGDRDGSILAQSSITSAGGSAWGYGAAVATERLSPAGRLNFTAHFNVTDALAHVDAADTIGYAYVRLDLSVYPPGCHANACVARKSVYVAEEGITTGLAPNQVSAAQVTLNVTAAAESGFYRMYGLAYAYSSTDTSFSTPTSFQGQPVPVPQQKITLPSVGGASASVNATLTSISWAPQ